MPLLGTSAAGVRGDGRGALLTFDRKGRLLGVFSSDARIADPRGIAVDQDRELLFLNSGSDRVPALDRHGQVVWDTGPIRQLNPAGGTFGPDGRYYIGLRSARAIMALPAALHALESTFCRQGSRRFLADLHLAATAYCSSHLASAPVAKATTPSLRLPPRKNLNPWKLVSDPESSARSTSRWHPTATSVVSSEHPFGLTDAVTSVREYGAADGRLIRVLSACDSAEFREPRGLRFGPDGTLYCVARDEVIAFDFGRGRCLGAVVRYPRLNGQAVVFFP